MKTKSSPWSWIYVIAERLGIIGGCPALQSWRPTGAACSRRSCTQLKDFVEEGELGSRFHVMFLGLTFVVDSHAVFLHDVCQEIVC